MLRINFNFFNFYRIDTLEDLKAQQYQLCFLVKNINCVTILYMITLNQYGNQTVEMKI